LGAKIGTNVKISKKNSKYSLFFGKKVAKLPIKEIYKKIHHILGLGFLSLLKNKFKKVWFCSKNLWSFNAKSLLGICNGYNRCNLTNL